MGKKKGKKGSAAAQPADPDLERCAKPWVFHGVGFPAWEKQVKKWVASNVHPRVWEFINSKEMMRVSETLKLAGADPRAVSWDQRNRFAMAFLQDFVGEEILETFHRVHTSRAMVAQEAIPEDFDDGWNLWTWLGQEFGGDEVAVPVQLVPVDAPPKPVDTPKPVPTPRRRGMSDLVVASTCVPSHQLEKPEHAKEIRSDHQKVLDMNRELALSNEELLAKLKLANFWKKSLEELKELTESQLEEQDAEIESLNKRNGELEKQLASIVEREVEHEAELEHSWERIQELEDLLHAARTRGDEAEEKKNLTKFADENLRLSERVTGLEKQLASLVEEKLTGELVLKVACEEAQNRVQEVIHESMQAKVVASERVSELEGLLKEAHERADGAEATSKSLQIECEDLKVKIAAATVGGILRETETQVQPLKETAAVTEEEIIELETKLRAAEDVAAGHESDAQSHLKKVAELSKNLINMEVVARAKENELVEKLPGAEDSCLVHKKSSNESKQRSIQVVVTGPDLADQQEERALAFVCSGEQVQARVCGGDKAGKLEVFWRGKGLKLFPFDPGAGSKGGGNRLEDKELIADAALELEEALREARVELRLMGARLEQHAFPFNPGVGGDLEKHEMCQSVVWRIAGGLVGPRSEVWFAGEIQSEKTRLESTQRQLEAQNQSLKAAQKNLGGEVQALESNQRQLQDKVAVPEQSLCDGTSEHVLLSVELQKERDMRIASVEQFVYLNSKKKALEDQVAAVLRDKSRVEEARAAVEGELKQLTITSAKASITVPF